LDCLTLLFHLALQIPDPALGLVGLTAQILKARLAFLEFRSETTGLLPSPGQVGLQARDLSVSLGRLIPQVVHPALGMAQLAPDILQRRRLLPQACLDVLHGRFVSTELAAETAYLTVALSDPLPPVEPAHQPCYQQAQD
jgi:hypothetical protein